MVWKKKFTWKYLRVMRFMEKGMEIVIYFNHYVS